MRYKGILLILLLVGLVFTACGPEQRGSVAGRIYNEATREMIAERVTIAMAGEVVVVENGEYILTNLPVGAYMMEVSAEGYSARNVPVEIEAEKTVTKDIFLTKDIVFFIDEVLVPGAPSFPTGEGDTEVCTEVDYPYYMGINLVTYDLWKEVYDWATDDARGSAKYQFEFPGVKGSDGASDKSGDHPVTGINWYCAAVWCNAMTEYYNFRNGTNLACAYTYRNKVVRDARNTQAEVNKNMVAEEGAKGFRLPTSMEWELAARWQDGTNWTPGGHVSGDTSGPCFSDDSSEQLSTVFGDYAWYKDNCGGGTNPVGTKEPTQLGIYDMCGNVYDMCYKVYLDSTQSIVGVSRGACWRMVDRYLRIDYVTHTYLSCPHDGSGFRLVRDK